MRHPMLVPATVALTMTFVGCASGGEENQGKPASTSQGADTANVAEMSVDLVNPKGSVVGTATFTDGDDGPQVRVEVSGLGPGFHGMHLHDIGLCEPGSPDPADPSKVGDFLSAGPHLGSADSPHGHHPGDLSPLLVNERGLGSTTSLVAVAKVEDLLEGDGTALVVHEAPDNLANVPPRYAPGGPDQGTLSNGDSGARIACGPVVH